MAADIAVGVKVFSRAKKLRDLLGSIEESPVSTVYVADDGEMSAEKADIYGTDYSFDLTVLDLPYDAGLGRGRARIVEALSEEYLLVCDSDHELVSDVTILRSQLQAADSLGGVSGLLREDGRITGTCHDLYVDGDVLGRNVRSRKNARLVAGYPFVPFDFVPNVAMFKRGCLADYCWDPAYVIGKEHLDFYVGHKLKTDWEFGVCPSVLFDHDPGGDSRYVANRESYAKLAQSRSHFLDKWGYDQILVGYTDWDGPSPREPPWRTVAQDAVKKLLLASPERVQKPLIRARNTARRWRNRPPL